MWTFFCIYTSLSLIHLDLRNIFPQLCIKSKNIAMLIWNFEMMANTAKKFI